jgi:phospholipid/cholesterol/gamma-HCH transport system substrate-binding protein
MVKLRGHLLTIAVAVLVAGGFLVTMLMANGARPGLSRGGYALRLMVPTAVSLGPGAQVRVAGLPVGRVDAIDRRGTSVIVTVDLEDDQGPLPADTTYAIRLRSLIGENYVELFPGHARRLLDHGAVLPVSAQRSEYVDLEQILDQLKGGTRVRAQRMFRGLGQAVGGRGGELNDVLAGSSGLLREVSPVMRTLAADRTRVAGLVEDVGDVMRAVGQRGADLQTLARDLRLSTTAIARRDDALRATIQELPLVMQQVRSTAGVLRATTARSAPVVSRLADALLAVRPAVQRLRPAAQEGRDLVREVDRAAPALRTILTGVRDAQPAATAALPQVRKVLCQVNPALQRLAPYSRHLVTVFQHMGSAANYYDAQGHAARLHAMVGEFSVPPTDANTQDALDALFESGTLEQLHQIGYNPYPKATESFPPQEGVGASGLLKTKIPYERVKAEC